MLSIKYLVVAFHLLYSIRSLQHCISILTLKGSLALSSQFLLFTTKIGSILKLALFTYNAWFSSPITEKKNYTAGRKAEYTIPLFHGAWDSTIEFFLKYHAISVYILSVSYKPSHNLPPYFTNLIVMHHFSIHTFHTGWFKPLEFIYEYNFLLLIVNSK